jgi:hypothetical protein
VYGYTNNNRMKRLFADIETSPNIVLAFSAGYGLNINHDAIIFERKIICIGYKWEDEKEVVVLRWDKDQNDKEMLRKFLAVAAEADEIVAHFGNGFDIPWLRTRCLYHRLSPVPLYKTVDTKALASKYFYFNSNKLDYISNFLGHGRKLHTDFSLWKKVLMDKCQKSLDYMCKYCKIDIVRLESVYKDMEPYVKPRTHVGVLHGGPKWSCPKCASVDVTKDKTRVTANGTTQHQMKCKKCGSYHTINETVFRQFKKEK